MKRIALWGIMFTLFGCQPIQQPVEPLVPNTAIDNPFIRGFNEVIPFADITAEDIPEATDWVLAKAQKMLDNIIAIEDSKRTFKNTIEAIDDILYEIGKVEYPVYLMGSVHPDALVRDNADSAIIKLYAWQTDFNLNEDLFNAIETFSNSAASKELKGEDFTLFDDIYKGFLRQGFGLPKEKRDEIKDIRNELSKIGLEFNNNITNYTDTLIVTEEAMDGTPDWYKDTYRYGDVYKIDISYPARRIFMQLSNDAEARKALSEKFLNRAADKNLELIPKMVEKHHELARLLGYKSYAEYLLEDGALRTVDEEAGRSADGVRGDDRIPHA